MKTLLSRLKPVLRRLPGLGRVAATVVAVAVAVVSARALWSYYTEAPWTRDGRVRADVVTVAPDVAGLVSEVFIRDNQPVRKGDPLFTIDRSRYRLAEEQARALVESRRAMLTRARQDMNRYAALSDAATSSQKREQATMDAEVAAAQYQQALIGLEQARLDLDRSVVRAPVNGVMANFSLQPGQYASVGKAVAALVATESLHVDGYFEETRLPRVHVGDPVTIRLMGEACPLEGHVESIAIGIEDRERADGAGLLANVNPSFSWVRLAQRIPVRIAIDAVPRDVRLIAGRTATVELHDAKTAEAPRWYGALAGGVSSAKGDGCRA